MWPRALERQRRHPPEGRFTHTPPAVECSHSAPNASAGPSGLPRGGGQIHRPSNSLISTAVQPASPRAQQPQQAAQPLPHQVLQLLQQHQQQPQPQQQQHHHHQSPKIGRANSVVSNSQTGGGGGSGGGHAGAPRPQGRAATPASLYGGYGSLPRSRARQQSPAHGSHAGGEQVGGECSACIHPASSFAPGLACRLLIVTALVINLLAQRGPEVGGRWICCA
jgi:hypothetical protein